MVNLNSPRTTLSVDLPADLVSELKLLAERKRRSVDEMILEACLAHTERHIWERCYEEWANTHPVQPGAALTLDGQTIPTSNLDLK